MDESSSPSLVLSTFFLTEVGDPEMKSRDDTCLRVSLDLREAGRLSVLLLRPISTFKSYLFCTSHFLPHKSFTQAVIFKWHFLDLHCTINGFLAPKKYSDVVSEGEGLFLCVNHDCFGE